MTDRKIKISAIKAFEEHLYEDEKSPRTIKKYAHDVYLFFCFANGKSVDKNTVLKYKEMLKEKYFISSANSMIASLNSFFRFLGWNDFLIKQFRIQRRAFCSSDKELTYEEYLRLIKTADREGEHKISLIIQTICSTGIRVGELQYLTAECVKKGEVTVSLKNKTRTIFIIKKLRNKLLKYIEKNKIQKGCVFVTKKGNPMDRSNIWREMKQLCKDAQVDSQKVFPHNLRHLFARTFYKMEKDVAKLADILGHSSINTTRIYIISTGEEHRRKMENMKLVI